MKHLKRLLCLLVALLLVCALADAPSVDREGN